VLPEIEELATLVVCEDDDPTRELLCDHLTADRYRVLPAPSAGDALRLCGYNQPDLLLLDLMLPDAAGIDVLRQIRAADRCQRPLRPRAARADRLRSGLGGRSGSGLCGRSRRLRPKADALIVFSAIRVHAG
jgi:CheY-like chemotaxis protein